jgi:hypothetical protein
MIKRVLRSNVDVEEQNMCVFDELFVSYRKMSGDRRSLDVGQHVLLIVDIDDRRNHPDAFTDEPISRPLQDAITPTTVSLTRSSRYYQLGPSVNWKDSQCSRS